MAGHRRRSRCAGPHPVATPSSPSSAGRPSRSDTPVSIPFFPRRRPPPVPHPIASPVPRPVSTPDLPAPLLDWRSAPPPLSRRLPRLSSPAGGRRPRARSAPLVFGRTPGVRAHPWGSCSPGGRTHDPGRWSARPTGPGGVSGTRFLVGATPLSSSTPSWVVRAIPAPGRPSPDSFGLDRGQHSRAQRRLG